MTDGSPISQNVKTCEKISTVEDDQAVLGALVEIRSRVSSVGRALDGRARGRGFDSPGWTNTQGLKITEK